MTTSLETVEFDTEYDELGSDYRALCSTAVASFVVGVLSIVAFLDWTLAVVPVCGIVLGGVALLQIRRSHGELTGHLLARLGVAFSLLFGTAGASWQSYVYLTEVPDGYERITYAALQHAEGEPGTAVPASAQALDGKRIFVKGYVYPGATKTGITQFILVRDNGVCCFGGTTPKQTDMIQVTLKDPLELTYSDQLRKLAGIFRVDPAIAVDGVGGVLYQLEAEYLK